MLEFQTVARYAVIGVFAVSLIAALASWLVRTQLVWTVSLHLVAATGLCPHRLGGRADPPLASPRRGGWARLEPARRLARALGAEAGAARHHRAVTPVRAMTAAALMQALLDPA